MPQAATIGRIVWVWLAEDSEFFDDDTVIDETQPFRADVVFIKSDGGVRLNVISHLGAIFDLDVGPVRDPNPTDRHGQAEQESYATWMPYQKAQHDKTETPAA
jgi:hypothetical protein